LIACVCVAGHTAASDGVACTACDAGTFKSEGGAVSACERCPANSDSSAGGVLCYCSPGFEGRDGGPCAACSDCTVAVTFTATLSMSMASFGRPSRDAYMRSVAEAVSVAASSVAIASVTEQFLRRRLRAAAAVVNVVVETTVTVARALAPLSASPRMP